MRFRSSVAVAFVWALGFAVASSACGEYSISNIRARKAFKDGMEAYKKADYKGAIVALNHTFEFNPNFWGIAYFFIGNSYDQLYKPARKGEAANDANLTKAVEYYKLAIEKIKDTDPQGAEFRKHSYEWLIAAYGPDKLDDLSQAEPLVRQLIDQEPNEPLNYQHMAKLYEDAGKFEEAETQYKKAIDVKPADPLSYELLAQFYTHRGRFEEAMDALYKRAALEPNNPEAWHTIGTYYSDKVTRYAATVPRGKMPEYVQKGLEAEDKALALSPDYYEAVSFKNILLRVRAKSEDPGKAKQTIEEADKLYNRALELRKKNEAGTGDAKKGRGGN